MAVRIRCDLTINGETRRVPLMSNDMETQDHMALKLTGVLLFWNYNLIPDISPNHVAIVNHGFQPDLVALSDIGEVDLWIECGNTALNKLSKLVKRMKDKRLIVIKEGRQQAENLRDFLHDADPRRKVEIIYWPDQQFQRWTEAITHPVCAVGETTENCISAVMNGHVFDVTFGKL